MIEQFKNEYHWLSNFEPVAIRVNNIIYPSVEHAYMSAKSNDRKWKEFCSNSTVSAKQVKVRSRRVKLIKNWDIVKIDIMKDCLRQKFNNPAFKERLIDTGNQLIQEGNTWNDTFWGVCLYTGKGKNMLGKLIMEIRDELKE